MQGKGGALETQNAAVELMKHSLSLHSDKVAYICGDRSITYRGLDDASRQFAFLLQKMAITPGDRVLLALPDCLAFPVALLGCLLSGAVAVMAGAALRDQDLAFVMEDCGARLLVRHASVPAPSSDVCYAFTTLICDDNGPIEGITTPEAYDLPYLPAGDDFAFMLYSSGSTGRLKGIPHGHASLLLPCALMGEALLGITADDVIFSTSKLSFGYGLVNSLSFPLYFGATAILHPGKPDVQAIFDLIAKHKPSVFFSVPTVYTQMLLSCRAPELKLPMRLCCSAGEALPALLFEEWQRLTGLEIIDGMGVSEFSHHFICNIPGQALAGSTGRLVPGYRVRLVDDHGNDVPSGREGHLLVSGGTRSPCYWNLPEKSAATMLPDGYTRTGDVLLEREGYYYYRGRSDDMIKVAGQWVSPVMVEDAIRSHRLVAECAVAPVTVGALVRPGAFVVLSPGVEQTGELVQELRKHVQSLLPGYMCPVRFKFLDQLPRTSTGKVQRFMLREQVHQGDQTDAVE